jgi:hypothetical protein
MLVIRDAQWAALGGVRERVFLTAQAERLAVAAPDLPNGARLAAAERLVERARGYGLRSPAELAAFVDLAATHGIELETLPENAWMRAMLTDPDVSVPGQRLERLVLEIARRASREKKNEEVKAAFFARLREREGG